VNQRLARIGQTDWSGANESTLREELLFPVLEELGYGQSTLNPIRREVSYQLQDPYLHEGRSRLRVDYLPTVLGRELWVLEAKGADDPHPERTLHQARSYAVHPEIRVPLLAVFDDRAVRVHDPWAMDWETPIVEVPVVELALRFDELYVVLSPNGVTRVVRRRQAQYVETALSASLDLRELDAARAEFDELFQRAEADMQSRRGDLEERVRAELAQGWSGILQSPVGVWAVTQHNNSVWVGVGQDVSDLVTAVRATPPNMREAEMRRSEDALAAQIRIHNADAQPASRPLWRWRYVRLAGALRLRRLAGCEQLADKWARIGLRDALLNFPDDAVARQAHRLEVAFAPVAARITHTRELVDYDAIVEAVNARRDPEESIRFPLSSDLFRRLAVNGSTMKILATTAWNEHAMSEMADAAEKLLAVYPRPDWVPAPDMWSDPLLEDWGAVEPLCDCTLVALMQGGAEDLLQADEQLMSGLVELSTRTETRTGMRAQAVLERVENSDGVAQPPSWWLSLEEDEPETNV
jgi:hypothetical protein